SGKSGAEEAESERGMVFGYRVLSVALFAIAFVVLLEEWVSTPVCNPLRRDPQQDDLKVMMVADLLLSEANHFFEDYYMSKFFRVLSHFLPLYKPKSFETLRPDLLLVLGDVSARGSELTRAKWASVLRRFYRVLGPFVGLPFHAVLGDRDIGYCDDLDVEKVSWIASKLPGLDSSGCAAFEIGNVSFVTLNSVALLCGNGALRFEVERVIERESVELRGTERVNADVLSGSGPVVLLHLPLDPTRNEHYGGVGDFDRSSKEGLDVMPKNREVTGGDLYELHRTLPLNASEYILQALKPRTREITVPAMSWNARDDPGFVIATFQNEGRAVSISYCSLARESHILLVYISVIVVKGIAGKITPAQTSKQKGK
ncbi:Metallophosphoesterase 1, partial [Mucuna pruriens]